MGTSSPPPRPSGLNSSNARGGFSAAGGAGWVRGVSWAGGLGAGIWGYDAGVEIAGIWLGLLMAFNLAVFAALLLTSILNRVRGWVSARGLGGR